MHACADLRSVSLAELYQSPCRIGAALLNTLHCVRVRDVLHIERAYPRAYHLCICVDLHSRTSAASARKTLDIGIMPGAHQVQLAIHCKKTEAVDLKGPLVAHIRATYTDREAEEASDDVMVIQQLRADIALAQNGPQPALRENLSK